MCTNDDSAMLLHQSHKYIWAKHRLASRFVATHIAIARHKINDVGFLWRFLGFVGVLCIWRDATFSVSRCTTAGLSFIDDHELI